MGLQNPYVWFALATGAAIFRPAQNIIIFFLAVHGATAAEKEKIIEALAKTRQFGLWAKPQWPRRKPPQGPPAIELIEPEAVEDEAA